MRAVLDTNILIDHLNGVEQAEEELARYDERVISIVTWIEVLAGAPFGQETALLRGILADFVIVPLSQEIGFRAADIRRSRRLRLPDAIILATAQHLGCLLVTRNTRDFPADGVNVHNPYVQ